VKRLLDVLGALVALLLVWPVIVVTAVLVRWKLGKPVLFKQWRPGLLGKPICLYKFRTMAEICGENGRLLSDDMRLTAFGKVLRRLSLDELPQLFNVLKGDLSLVGPRPLLMEYLPRYTLEQLRRHQVKPGITGWAQVNGRNAISWEEKFKLDVWYVDNQSLWLDLRILLLTVLSVLKHKDISAQGSATMPEFLGSPKP
jgi:sugar transferase EpsL